MSRLLRPNYAQRLLLPPSLDDWVPPDHPVRFVSEFVDALDLRQLGFAEPAPGDEGRPAYAPELLLKVWLFGYMERIRSTRQLEKACLSVMPFLWLTGNLHPDHNTLWRFFNANRAALPKLFKQVVKIAAGAGLVGFALHALDGTKLVAASSTDTALHRKSLEEKLKGLDALIASYVEQVTSEAEADKGEGYAMPPAMADSEARKARIRQLLERRLEDREDERPKRAAKASKPRAKATRQRPLPGETGAAAVSEQDDADDEPPPQHDKPTASTTERMLEEAQRLRDELQASLDKLDAADVNHLHEAEPEARMMKGRGGTHALGYNAQVVVDHDSDLMVAADVVAEQNDLGRLVPMLSEVHETLGRVAEQTVADNGYASGEQLKSAEDKQMPVLVALREEPDVAGAYAKVNFRYDAESNVYICPQGEQLVQIGTNKSHASAKEPDAIFQCNNKTCPVRAQCTTSARGRRIRRPYGEEARERQGEKQANPRMRVLLSLRKEVVEHLFGIIKMIDGFRRFTVRGLAKVQAQWSLVCTAVNLRKLSALAVWNERKLVALGTANRPVADMAS